MDTVMDLSAYGEQGEIALDNAQDLIRELEGLLSTTREGSEIYALNHGETVALSPSTRELLDRALALCGDTGGALDITIYPVVRAWGFTTEEYQVPDSQTLTALLDKVDYTQITLEGDSLLLPDGMELDLGAVAKGYTGDRLMELFRQSEIASAYVNLGGNVQVLGASPDGDPWRIGIRDPDGEGYAAVVEVTDRAVVTSGAYERYFEQGGVRYGHIIDPDTGYPARSGLISVTIVSQSGTLADGLSTALFVMGKDRAVQFWRTRDDFDFILIEEDGTVTISQGIENSFSFPGEQGSYALEVVRR
ncbi:MAG TPA: FAD:protein FMN transferase [Candidatus Enterenecus stercoripullorum]|nr:FAD:protein FMN transferase [Candidatus Enterenecus stercoripullorum]